MDVKIIIFNGNLEEEIYINNLGASHLVKVIPHDV